MDGNEDDFFLFLRLEVHKGATLTEVFGVGGEDIVGVETPVHSSLLKNRCLSVPDWNEGK